MIEVWQDNRSVMEYRLGCKYQQFGITYLEFIAGVGELPKKQYNGHG
jgi:hypothetical protein